MKKKIIILLALILTITMGIASVWVKQDTLAKGFITPPDSIQTSVYWYWISDNISKEGVVKDLYSMKKAGINRAFIGNIGLGDLPYGKVKMFSDEWWDVLHTALKTATELGIDIGIFNSPGWSQSGGPWIKPEEAMRYLASSEVRVKGPLKLKQKLNKPKEIFQDVKVIAFPVRADDGWHLPHPVTYGKPLEISFDKPETFRSLSVRSVNKPFRASAVFEAMDEKGDYNVIAQFEIDRANVGLNVGFEPYAPATVTLPEVAAVKFRLTLRNFTVDNLIDVELSAIPRVERYSEKMLAKMFPAPLPYWHEYQWRVQPEPSGTEWVVDANKVTDLTALMEEDGTLTWDVPEGEWIVQRMGMTPTGTVNSPASPDATGYEVDKMSKKHVAKHFHAFIGDMLQRFPEADRKCFKVVVEDSYETGGQNFTDGFIEDFRLRYGYDPVPYLPVYGGYVVGSQRASDGFLWDVRRLVADKVAYDYVGGLREVSHRYGLTTWLECYGHWGFPSEFLMYGGQSDEIGGEFWSEGELGNIENRAAISCGHIYGKTKISAESNTCSGRPFARYPAETKQRCDRFFAEGINNTLLHVYISQPYEERNPGINAWFGNEYNRKNTWFSQIDLYTTYLKRVNYMLQQGLNVADVAYFIGEDAPKMTGITDPALPIGYQFDYINAEVIERDMKVKDGMWTLPHGTQYRILVLPRLETMRPELLARIAELVGEGAVVLGPAPMRSPSLQNQPEADRRVRDMAAGLWGAVDGINCKYAKYGKGTVMNGLSMEEAFARINCIADCGLSDNRVHYGHRTMKDGDIYFLTNQTDAVIEIAPAFRTKKRLPELWDAVTGSIRRLPAFETTDSTTVVPLRLEKFESVFVVFREKTSRSGQSGITFNYPAPTEVHELTGAWTVVFDTTMRGPKEKVVFESLIDWTKSEDERIRYYSGTAVYTKNFTLGTASGQTFIDLGNLTAMAKIYINGEYAGGAWTKPYRLDISNFVRKGNNTLDVEVVNTWVNRLIGDQRLPEDQRLTWCLVNGYKADSRLQPSGLFGPVTVFK